MRKFIPMVIVGLTLVCLPTKHVWADMLFAHVQTSYGDRWVRPSWGPSLKTAAIKLYDKYRSGSCSSKGVFRCEVKVACDFPGWWALVKSRPPVRYGYVCGARSPTEAKNLAFQACRNAVRNGGGGPCQHCTLGRDLGDREDTSAYNC